MLSEPDAKIVVQRAFPDRKVESFIPYKGLWLFKAFSDDPEEGQYDPFFSVNQQTGELRDFSVITDGDPNEIAELYLKKQKS